MVASGHTDASRFAIGLVRKFLDRLVSHVSHTVRSPDVDQVHDLRVTIRRFAQVLRIFKLCFPVKEVKRIQRALKKHMALAGEVRDLDIAAGLLGKSRLAEAATFRAKLHGRRKNAGRTLAGKLQRWKQRRMYSKWRRKLLLSPAELGTTEDVASEILPRLLQRFVSAGDRAATGTPDMEKLHTLRIAGKKLRYTLEVFEPLGNRIGPLKKLQGVLGDIHDAEIVRAMLLKEDAGDKLVAEVTRKRDHKVEGFRSRWKAEFGKHFSSFPVTRRVPRKPPLRSESRRPVHVPFAAARVAD